MNKIDILLRMERIPKVEWKLIDVSAVIALLLLLASILSFFIQIFLPNGRLGIILIRYWGFSIGFFIPLLWVKVRYQTKIESLGFRCGTSTYPFSAILGISAAVLFSLVYRVSPFWRSYIPASLSESISHMDFILFPFSITGFAALILTPLWEETVFRGFIYGYLRKMVGAWPGLILQALFFSLLHIGFIFSDSVYQVIYRTVIGLILGILYEISGSVYPSMIFHGMITYILLAFTIYWN